MAKLLDGTVLKLLGPYLSLADFVALACTSNTARSTVDRVVNWKDTIDRHFRQLTSFDCCTGTMANSYPRLVYGVSCDQASQCSLADGFALCQRPSTARVMISSLNRHFLATVSGSFPLELDGPLPRCSLLGDTGSGKSSTTLRLVQDIFATEYDPTIEDEYRKLVWDALQLGGNAATGAKLTSALAEWVVHDTGPYDEAYISLRDMIWREPHIGVVVLNGSNPSMSVSRVEKEALHHRDGLVDYAQFDVHPMVVVMTHHDINYEPSDIGLQCAERLEASYFEISNRTGQNVDALRLHLIQLSVGLAVYAKKVQDKRKKNRECIIN